MFNNILLKISVIYAFDRFVKYSKLLKNECINTIKWNLLPFAISGNQWIKDEKVIAIDSETKWRQSDSSGQNEQYDL